MTRICDIENVKRSMVRGSVSICSCLGVTPPLVKITFSLSDKENDRIYDFIYNYLMTRPKIQVYFVFRGFRKFARPLLSFNSSYVAIAAARVERICSKVIVSCVLTEITEDIPNDDFFDAVNYAEWNVRMRQRSGLSYIELREV